MKVLLRYGIRGGRNSEVIIPDEKSAQILAHGLSFVFGRDGENKDWKISKKSPRVSWESSTYFVSIQLLDKNGKEYPNFEVI